MHPSTFPPGERNDRKEKKKWQDNEEREAEAPAVKEWAQRKKRQNADQKLLKLRIDDQKRRWKVCQYCLLLLAV